MVKGLVGEKLGHSFSKVIHEKLTDGIYNLYSLNKDEFNGFFENKKFDFVNVTIPYKEEVKKYLDYISDAAEEIGAVNLVINKDGKLYGYNTDYYGFMNMLKYNNVDVEGKNCLILGTGGTSKTVKKALSDMGANNVYKASRNKSKDFIGYDEVYNYDIDIIINTTPVGMYPNIDGCVIDITKFSKVEAVVDVVYNPLKTRLLIEAEKNGIKTVNGLLMLVLQAVKAVEIVNDFEVSREKVFEIYNDLLSEKRNIVLIGMPGCGKTTIGERLSADLNKEFIDIDKMIEADNGMKISYIFENYGEKHFRDLETESSLKVGLLNGKVISTGGGVIKNYKNIQFLKSNGLIIYIKRDIKDIILDENRPLSKNISDLEKLYNERKELYESYADVIVENNATIMDVVNKIKLL